MTSDDAPSPPARNRKPETDAREAERRQRLAAALRENLRKRKQQARPKTSSGGGDGVGS